ncbi:ferric reductase like transmembrane component [Xylariales sp. AK1849]|nr:ferric reductase like transmembrane component [Xylariales sp. AK1849]
MPGVSTHEKTSEWPYQFLKLSPEQRAERRILLDRYGLYAQLSALLPIVAYFLVIIAARLLTRAPNYSTVLDLRSLKTRTAELSSPVSSALRRIYWWLGGELEFASLNLGGRGHLIFGTTWMVWLLFLCTHKTGNDYSHLSRRFAAIATSQLPMQYILATKRLDPFALIFHTSHLNMNWWHRVLGWITYSLILFHGVLYLNYYFQTDGLGPAFLRLVPVLGMLGLLGMTFLSATTLSIVRQYSYRVFLIVHILVALSMPVIIWFHVPHGRTFMAECLSIIVVDRILRRFGTVRSLATVQMIPGTDLIEIASSIPDKKRILFSRHPVSHVYLSIPPASRPGRSQWSLSNISLQFISNPFTVASVNEEDGKLTLVARQMNGTLTKTLARLASLQSLHSEIALNIDGPYGAAPYLPDLSKGDFDTVLLVAGGVGATFILPLYEHITSEDTSVRTQLVWTTRKSDEIFRSVLTSGLSIFEDERVNIFITGIHTEDATFAVTGTDGYDDVELNTFEKKDDVKRSEETKLTRGEHRRPDLQKIVDEVFQGEDGGGRVAVIVCGPPQMVRDIRKAVGFWVKMGKNVLFHAESFRW